MLEMEAADVGDEERRPVVVEAVAAVEEVELEEDAADEVDDVDDAVDDEEEEEDDDDDGDDDDAALNDEETPADEDAPPAGDVASVVDDQSSQATDETPDTGEASQTSPYTPPLDDFLAIVPKPTLLSKERAKKRLQAFNMSKLNEYYISKKKAAAAAQLSELALSETKAKAEPAKPEKKPSADRESAHEEPPPASQKSKTTAAKSRRASCNQRRARRQRGTARKRTRSRSPPAAGGHKRTRRNSLRNRLHSRERRKDEHSNDRARNDRDKPKSGHSRSRPDESTKSAKSKRTRSPSNHHGDASNHHDEKEKEAPQELSDIRKMLLFNSVCYSFKPFHYKKLDGTQANLSIQYLRYTTAARRIAYSPNPSRTKGTYFQRDEVLAVVGKTQKEAIVGLIAQAAKAKPLAPSQPMTTRSWFPRDALTERHADESPYYEDAELEQYAKKVANAEAPPTKSAKRQRKPKKEKKAKQRDAKRKRHKKDASGKRRVGKNANVAAAAAAAKEASPRVKPPESVPAAGDTKSRKPRTDSHKSDTHKSDAHSSNANDTKAAHGNKHNNAKHSPEAPKTPPMRKPNHIYRRRPSDTTKSDSFRLKLDKVDPLKSINSLREDLREELSVLNCKSVLAELSKGQISIPPTLISTPTKIYKIKTDCIDKLDFTPMVQNVFTIVNEPKEEPPPVPAKCEAGEDGKQDVKNLLNRIKEPPVPIEKLKSKPSELYSPTLQSLSSESSGSDTEMADAADWTLNDSQDGGNDDSPKLLDSSWESEDECYVLVHRETRKTKTLEERSLEMPLNINISRPRSQVILPKAMPDIKAPSIFDDLESETCWDADMRHNDFDLEPNSPNARVNLEQEYMQFMSSVSTIEEKTDKRRYSTSTDSSSASSSSSSESGSSAHEHDEEESHEPCTSSEVMPVQTHVTTASAIQGSPVCNVDSTSSPAIAAADDLKDPKTQFPMGKPLPAIVLAKKHPLVGCSLFQDEDSDHETSQTSTQTPTKSAEKVAESDARRPSPSAKRSPLSPPKPKAVSPTRRDSSTVRHYSARNRRPIRRDDSPKRTETLRRDARRGGSPRRPSPRRSSPRRSPKRGLSPRRTAGSRTTSPRRFPSPRLGSPKRTSRDNSPRYRELEKNYSQDGGRRREVSPRHRGPPVRRRSRSPKHDHHRRGGDHDGLRSVRDERYRDHKYRDVSPRYRDSPPRFSPSRRRSPPRHRYSPKRDGSPRYRGRSPRRRSLSPNRRIYSRSCSKERKHETITQALHRLAGMEYEPPKSPRLVDSPMDGYIRGVADSTISDEQLLQNRGSTGGGEFNSTQSPVFFNAAGSPKRIPLDDRINQVLGIDAAKDNNDYTTDQYYNQQMYYDQYGSNMQQQHHYDHYGTVNTAPTKVLQVGNVLQVVPTEQQPPPAAKDTAVESLPEVNHLPDTPKKFVPVGNMLEIVPTAELPKPEEVMVAPEVPEPTAAKLAEDLLQLRTAERKTEREKRRQERDRRRKEKELKRSEREQRRQLKFKLKSEAMIKKALMYDGVEDAQADDMPKSTSVTITSTGARVLKGILTRKSNETVETETSVSKKKGVKFADGVLPGEGTSPSAGEELSSPPPFSKVHKEKRYTKTKKPKAPHKKKIKVKIVRTKTKKADDAGDDNLPAPSPPPGSPPPHLFPPRVKANLINPAFFANYPFNPLACAAAAFPPETSTHPPFTTLPPNMQYPPLPHLHLPAGPPPPPITTLPPMHPISALLLPPPPAPARLVAKPPPALGKPIDKGI